MTESQAYYRTMGSGSDNVQLLDKNLIINCTGLLVQSKPFGNHAAAGREDYYLQYLAKGNMDVWIDGTPYTMTPGQAILYYPHTSYRYAMHGQEEVQYYWIHFTGFGAAELVEGCGIPNRTLLNIGTGTSLELDFEDIFRDFMVRDSCFDLSSAAKLTSICVAISRRSEAAASSPAETDSRIYHSLTHIHKNYAHNLNIEELAAQEHLSPSRFRTLFKERTGLSPMDYLTALRINHARQLMSQTELTMREIADMVGYEDQLYFSRIFKKRTGFTPSAYRRSLKKQQT
ncbi:MAG: helix-turn-helix transcriptional regulator [Oscillospiraceae bacterium]|nr:helix-turn-helix transcriptional regulator [Oscillospiraceae bacterium]